MLKRVFLALALLLLPTQSMAQDARLGVSFHYVVDDPVGKQLAFFLRDEVRKSGTFREAVADDALFKIEFVTMDPWSDQESTIYSYTILISNSEGLDYYVTSFVGACGKDHVRSCASSAYAGLGEQLETIRAAVQAKKRTGFNQ